LQTPRTAATDQPKALVNAAKFTAAEPRTTIPTRELNDAHNMLISKGYLFETFLHRRLTRSQALWPVGTTANRRKYLKLF
jgi:hypothetical protein